MMSARLAVFSVLLCLGATACGSVPDAPPPPPLPANGVVAPTLSAQDACLLQKINEMDLTQKALAALAASHSNSDVLKVFAGQLVSDHETNRAALMKVANTANLTVPDKLSAAGQAQIDALTPLYRTNFDRVFLRQIIGAPSHAFIVDLQKAAKEGSTPDMKTLASDTIAMEKGHIQRARDMMGGRWRKGRGHILP